MRKLIFILFIFLTTHVNFSQSFKFQDITKITKEELLESRCEKFPESNSIVLMRKELIKFENIGNDKLIQKTEIKERVKIYNKDGFDQAAKIINLFNNKNVIDLEGTIYNLVGNEIVKGNIKKDSIVETYENSKLTTFKYVFPDLKEGCIIEYWYILKSDCCLKSNIILQKEVPIKNLEVKINIPESLNYKTTLNPNSKIVHNIESSSGIYNNNQLKVAETSEEVIQEKNKEEIITITNADIPPFIKEPFANNESYISKLTLEPIQLKPGSRNILSNTWEEISLSIYNSSEFAHQIDNFELFKDDLESVIRGNESESERAIVLFNFVKLKIKWNGLEGYFADKGVEQAFKNGKGNVADINLTLLSLLRSAGLNAYPVLLSTIENGVSSNPTSKAFNYVICAVLIDGEYMLLDATDEFTSPNILPLRALNWKGMLIKDEGTSKWIDIVPKMPSTKKITVNAKIQPDFSLKGHVKIQYSDYQSLKYRREFNGKTQKDLINNIEKSNFGLNVYDFKSKSENDYLNITNQSFEFRSRNFIKKRGDKLYFSPILFLENKLNPFKEEERQFPVDFLFPFEDEYQINIIFPEGYELEGFPKNEIIQYGSNDGQLDYYVKETGKMLQFIISLKLNKTLILPEDYQGFKQFYESIFEKKKEKVILRKVKYENRKRTRNSR